MTVLNSILSLSSLVSLFIFIRTLVYHFKNEMDGVTGWGTLPMKVQGWGTFFTDIP